MPVLVLRGVTLDRMAEILSLRILIPLLFSQGKIKRM